VTVVSIADLTNKSTVKSSVSGAGVADVHRSIGRRKARSVTERANCSVLDAQVPAITSTVTPWRAGGTLFGSDLYNGTTLQISAGAVSQGGNSFSTKFVHT